MNGNFSLGDYGFGDYDASSYNDYNTLDYSNYTSSFGNYSTSGYGNYSTLSFGNSTFNERMNKIYNSYRTRAVENIFNNKKIDEQYNIIETLKNKQCKVCLNKVKHHKKCLLCKKASCHTFVDVSKGTINKTGPIICFNCSMDTYKNFAIISTQKRLCISYITKKYIMCLLLPIAFDKNFVDVGSGDVIAILSSCKNEKITHFLNNRFN